MGVWVGRYMDGSIWSLQIIGMAGPALWLMLRRQEGHPVVC